MLSGYKLNTIGPLNFIMCLLIVLTCCNRNNKESETSSFIEEEIVADIPPDSLKKIIYFSEPKIDGEDEQLVRLYEATGPVYDILYKIALSSQIANTPNNNLNWYRIINDLISSSEIPKDSIYFTISEIINWYDGGTQNDINYAAYMRQVMMHYHELEQFNEYLELYPTQNREFALWTAIQSFMIDSYVKDMYGNNHYSSLPMDVSAGIVNYLTPITTILKMQNDLLKGKSVKIVSNSHERKPLENEKLMAQFSEWKKEREKFSKSLPSNIQGDYDKITLLLENSILQ